MPLDLVAKREIRGIKRSFIEKVAWGAIRLKAETSLWWVSSKKHPVFNRGYDLPRLLRRFHSVCPCWEWRCQWVVEALSCACPVRTTVVPLTGCPLSSRPSVGISQKSRIQSSGTNQIQKCKCNVQKVKNKRKVVEVSNRCGYHLCAEILKSLLRAIKSGNWFLHRKHQ